MHKIVRFCGKLHRQIIYTKYGTQPVITNPTQSYVCPTTQIVYYIMSLILQCNSFFINQNKTIS